MAGKANIPPHDTRTRARIGTFRPSAAGPVTNTSLLTAPRRALVIGNGSYPFGALRNPVNDARAMAEELRRQGFEVTTGLDLKRAEMIELIEKELDVTLALCGLRDVKHASPAILRA